jgi:hypothetical protein
VTAALERVDGLAGSIRRDGKKVVGVRCEKHPASDDDVKVFAGLPDLEELAIQGETVTDAAVERLAGLPKLCDLSLEGTSITDGGAAKLKQLRCLQRLSLGRTTSLTDAAMAHLAALPGLQCLELLRISDKGLVPLKDLKNLKRLSLAMVTVSDEAVRALQAAIPGAGGTPVADSWGLAPMAPRSSTRGDRTGSDGQRSGGSA